MNLRVSLLNITEDRDGCGMLLKSQSNSPTEHVQEGERTCELTLWTVEITCHEKQREVVVSSKGS